MKPIFEEEIKKPKNIKILNYLSGLRGLDKDEIEQLKLITLFESIRTFDETKKCLFSTHLYNRCRYTYLDFLKKKKIKTLDNIEIVQYNHENIIDDLPDFYKIIIEDRFVYKLTIVEMSKKYELKRWQIKSLIEDSVNFLKKELEKRKVE
jgi:DNA-directed RNA polymerase specialized sigma subunit